jgi:uncharacterized protein YdeI (YjbR/CyaY-like superfamily)
MQATYFSSAVEFRDWLEKNHDKVAELLVGFYRKSSGKTGISYEEVVNEALCFGWIDGIKKKASEISYTHRFTPRKPRSIWSVINIKRAGDLIKQKRMKAPGLKVFEARDPKRSGIYSFENAPRTLTPTFEKQFKASKKAWDFFQAQPPGYRRLANHWVMSAKQEETRVRRLGLLIGDSEKGVRLAETLGKSRKGI